MVLEHEAAGRPVRHQSCHNGIFPIAGMELLRVCLQPRRDLPKQPVEERPGNGQTSGL